MGRKLDPHPVARADPHKIPGRGCGGMRQHLLAPFHLHPEGGIRKQLHDRPCQSLLHVLYGFVNTHGPLAVTATQCSKWAE